MALLQHSRQAGLENATENRSMVEWTDFTDYVVMGCSEGGMLMGLNGAIWASSGSNIPNAAEVETLVGYLTSVWWDDAMMQKLYNEGLVVNGVKYMVVLAKNDDGPPYIYAKRGPNIIYLMESVQVAVLGVGTGASCMQTVTDTVEQLWRYGY